MAVAMQTSRDDASDGTRQGKVLRSAYDSQTFDADTTFQVPEVVGSATISPCNRDIALAS